MTPSSGQDAGLYRRVCNKSPIFSQRLYRGVFSRPNLGKMVSDGGGGPSDQSSGLPIDRASHESSRSRARTRSRSPETWLVLLARTPHIPSLPKISSHSQTPYVLRSG